MENILKKLIITADDYGMCASVNSAIDECIAAGTVHSTCVMTNMPACEPASQLKRRFPAVSVGLHWTLTEGRPVLKPLAVPSLVNAQGHFFSAGEFRKRWLQGHISQAEIRQELIAQYQRFRDLVGEPDYWNSHENVHVWPMRFQLFTRIGQELNIGQMRSHVRVTVPYLGTAYQYNCRHPLHYLKGQIISSLSACAKQKGMAMPAGLIYLQGFQDGKAAIATALQKVPWPKASAPIELTIHPATQVETELFGSLTESRVREYHYFSQTAVAEQLARLGVLLVGFESLLKEKPYAE
jgi:predicted glycoside hydrolase/deacetylase ChbG (UPF0249 family)